VLFPRYCGHALVNVDWGFPELGGGGWKYCSNKIGVHSIVIINFGISDTINMCVHMKRTSVVEKVGQLKPLTSSYSTDYKTINGN